MNSLRVGWFLAVRQLKRTSIWTTLLIIFVMMLTFLNLVVVGGILLGLPVGATIAYNQEYSGDIMMRSLSTKDYIEQSDNAINTINAFPEVRAVSSRYIGRARIDANYKNAVGPNQNFDSVFTPIAGIDPDNEKQVTGIGLLMREGEMLKKNEEGYVVIGKNLIDKYTVGLGVLSANVLNNVETGSRVRISVNGNEGEYTVKGILGAKTAEVSTRIYMTDTELRRLLGRTDRNVGEIAIRLHDEKYTARVENNLQDLGLGGYAKINNARGAQGAGLDDIEDTFTILSNIIGGIGLLVASITVFIVIYINAVTRRKYIGILKGIGISSAAIKISYVLQSIFYALCGSIVGLGIVYGFLLPYFILHPIDFPFADGILLVPYYETFIKSGILVFVTIIAGYYPARMIVSKNTLDSILGR